MDDHSGSPYEAVIGLEVHAQLGTHSKLFAGDSTRFGNPPNTQVSPITLGHPGTLPRMNKEAIVHAIKMGLVCHAEIAHYNYFARKNYFYPDLPKGYQISQHTTPICAGGYIRISTTTGDRDIKLTRIHLEEDAGKSIHDQNPEVTYLDFNRAGVPLIEIVSEPDMHSAEEAAAYLTKIRQLVRWIGVCDGNMEEGSLRCDANISVRPAGSPKLGTRVEVKNLNSIKHLRHAVELEIARLTAMTRNGETIIQETRSYDADRGITFSIRTKEDAEDYRYFPEPDLAPFQFTDDFVKGIKDELPELPDAKKERYMQEHGLSAYDADQLTEDYDLNMLFEKLGEATPHKKQLVNFLIGPVRSFVNTQNLTWDSVPTDIRHWKALLDMVAGGKLSFSLAAQKIVPEMLSNPTSDPMQLAVDLNLIQDADEGEIRGWVMGVMEAMPDKVAEYRKGKKGLIGLFVGEVKKISKGKADPKRSTELLTQALNEKQ
ncbi:MAG: Asp-tRNA(Asn)/Glu-tRNA(Gln) amidotransferase subunit GatB [Bacteroidota bacterium]